MVVKIATPPEKNRTVEGQPLKEIPIKPLFSPEDEGNQVAGQMNCKQHYYFLKEVVYIHGRLYFSVSRFIHFFPRYPFFIADKLVIYCKRAARRGCKQLLQVNRETGWPVNVFLFIPFIFLSSKRRKFLKKYLFTLLSVPFDKF